MNKARNLKQILSDVDDLIFITPFSELVALTISVGFEVPQVYISREMTFLS